MVRAPGAGCGRAARAVRRRSRGAAVGPGGTLAIADGFEKEPLKAPMLKAFLEEKAEFKGKPTFVIVAAHGPVLDLDGTQGAAAVAKTLLTAYRASCA